MDTTTATTATTTAAAATTEVTMSRNHVIWGIAYERDGRTVTSSTYYATRANARLAKAEYRSAGLRAYVVRYTPIIDTRS